MMEEFYIEPAALREVLADNDDSRYLLECLFKYWATRGLITIPKNSTTEYADIFKEIFSNPRTSPIAQKYRVVFSEKLFRTHEEDICLDQKLEDCTSSLKRKIDTICVSENLAQKWGVNSKLAFVPSSLNKTPVMLITGFQFKEILSMTFASNGGIVNDPLSLKAFTDNTLTNFLVNSSAITIVDRYLGLNTFNNKNSPHNGLLTFLSICVKVGVEKMSIYTASDVKIKSKSGPTTFLKPHLVESTIKTMVNQMPKGKLKSVNLFLSNDSNYTSNFHDRFIWNDRVFMHWGIGIDCLSANVKFRNFSYALNLVNPQLLQAIGKLTSLSRNYRIL